MKALSNMLFYPKIFFLQWPTYHFLIMQTVKSDPIYSLIKILKPFCYKEEDG